MDFVPKLLFYATCFRTVSPFLRHRYALHPIYFTLMGTAIVFFAACVTLFADPAITLLTTDDDGRKRGIQSLFNPTTFLFVSITHTTVTLTGILCYVLWARAGLLSSLGMLSKMLSDLSLIEEGLWSKSIDLRAKVPPTSSTPA